MATRLSLLALTAMACLAETAADDSSPPAPLIVAHRGASHYAPENTLPAFELAWQQGADAIEGDFHLTRDGHIVCIHDLHTGLLGGRRRAVSKTDLAQLRALDAGHWKGPEWVGTQIPTLPEVLALVPPDKLVFLEIKSHPRLLPQLLRDVDASGLQLEQIRVIAFSGRLIRNLKSERPEITAFLLSDLRRHPKTGRLAPDPDTLLAALRRSRADGLGVFAHPNFDQTYANRILTEGYELHVWTVDDPAEARRWATLGVKSITTNRPAHLRQALTSPL